jgi:peptidoglycan/xylan/chitin deacetylase (PgdA/CDA1 family)
VLVTFDDGYKDFHDVAYPILRTFGIPAVNFVSTHFVDTGELFWWDAIDLAVRATNRPKVVLPWGEWPPVTLDKAGRSWLALEARRHIKSGPDVERDARLETLFDALGVRRQDLHCERQVMTWDEIRAVSDLTTIGAHTHTHPLLSRVDSFRLDSEIRMCRERLLEELGGAPTLFAYPSGQFTAEAKEALRRHGFGVAFSKRRAMVGPRTDWLEVPRVYAPAEADLLPISCLRAGSTREAQ